ncbi:MAG: 5-formyltetrahydrofolate cyclo-ligase [bacterium]|nr:5-formyltetrahydrofolate cyclo-ligase [bacterium]
MKEEIRKEIRTKRDSLSEKEILEKSEIIKERLFALKEFKDAHIILFYVSTRSEVKTDEMIRQSLSLKKRVILPKVRGGDLLLSELKDFPKELEKGAYGIYEPKSGYIREINHNEIDLVIVPGIAFDRFGFRLGYGGGFYDKLLSMMKNQSFIGLAYEMQIIDKIPVREYDIAVHKIITEERVITIRDF